MGEPVIRIHSLKESPVLWLTEVTHQSGINNGIEGNIMRLAHAWIHPGVTQHHMPQLMHDEQKKVLITLAIFLYKVRIYEQAGTADTLNCGARELARYSDISESTQSLHLESGCRHTRNQPVLNRVFFKSCDFAVLAHRYSFSSI
jgi:hypothetical protein